MVILNTNDWGIIMTNSDYILFLDESATLTVEIKPENATNKNYSFSTNPTSLGQIENNIFTAKAVGTVEIADIVGENGQQGVIFRSAHLPLLIQRDIVCQRSQLLLI